MNVVMYVWYDPVFARNPAQQPVGSVWTGLDRPGYGIHGTPQPEKVGRAEFRLANWNAQYLLKLAWIACRYASSREA